LGRCTAVAETQEGAFEIIRWMQRPQQVPKTPALEELEAAA
jgi:hypothetical protein